MSEVLEYHAPYVVHSNDIMPIEPTFSRLQDPLAGLGKSLTREKSIEKSVQLDSDSEKATVVTVEDTYPDGGLRAWLVVLGCFMYTCTVLYVLFIFPICRAL